MLAVIGDKPHSSVICCLKQKCLFDTEFVFGFGVWQVGSSMLLCVVVEAGDGVGIMSDGNVAAHKSLCLFIVVGGVCIVVGVGVAFKVEGSRSIPKQLSHLPLRAHFRD